MEQNLRYTTSDMYLAAYLKLKGLKLLVEKNKNKATFIEYLNENGSCEPLLYTNAIKNLKNLLYNL